jgi:biopolymer transport protein ExbB
MVDRFLNMALIGGEPVLYALIVFSLLSVAVAVERFIYYARNRIDVAGFTLSLVHLLNKGEIEKAQAEAKKKKAAEAKVALEGLKNFDKSPTVIARLMESMALRQQQKLDKRLTILGTVGSNVPFVGLLGTVLGIIKAFHDLSFDTAGGASVVMAGIAEALVATAVGLLVAIPAVICFNYFKNRQKRIMNNIEQIQKTLLAFAGAGNSKDPLPAKKAA